MPIVYNVSPYPLVLSWDEPAVLPGEAIEVTDAQAAGLNGDWSLTPPVKADEAPIATETSNKSRKGDKAEAPPAPENETPVAESPVEQEA